MKFHLNKVINVIAFQLKINLVKV